VPDLHDKFILTADVVDRLSRCNTNTSITVIQAQVNDDVNLHVVVDSGNNINKGVMNSSPLTLPQANDDVTSTSSVLMLNRMWYVMMLMRILVILLMVGV